MKSTSLGLCAALLFMVAGLASAAGAPQNFDYPFGNRLIMAETPETGTKWHGGIRMKDLIDWDLYWNAAGWFTIDFMTGGLSGFKVKDQESGGTDELTDNMKLFSIKTRPLCLSLYNAPYKAALGLTVLTARFQFLDEQGSELYPGDNFRQTGIFIVQSWLLNERHYFNLLASVTSQKTTDTKSIPTVYLVPGYRFLFGAHRRWSFDFEYYYMNPLELPITALQLAFDADKSPFSNPDRQFVSFMFWGFSYSFRHVRLEAHVGNHYSFRGPILPMLGAGWDF